MAQIPGAGQLGYDVPQPTRTPLASPDSYGAGLGRVVEQVGNQVAAQERHAAALAEQQRKAAEKANAMSELQAAQDDLAAIHDEVAQGVRAGTIPKQDAAAEWQRRAGERVAKAGENLPTDYQQIGNRELSARVNRFGRAIGGVVMERDQQDVRSGIDQTLEYASRLYAKGDRQTADQMVAGTLESLGPFSGLAPDQIQKKQQAYREASRFTYASGLVSDARRDNGALDKVEKQLGGDEFADMDPQRKQALLTSIDGYRISNIQRAEAEARRIQAAQEHQLKVAEATYNAASLLINQGKVLSPEYVDQVTKATAGTPYGAAFRESIKTGPEKAAFGQQPLAVQQQALQSLRGQLNTTGTDPKIEKRFGELETIYNQAVQDYANDPLPAAQERGVIGNIEPINTSSIQALVATVGSRVGQAQIVQQQVGAAVSPLTQREAEDVSQLINVLPADQRASAVAQIAEAVGGPTAQALGRQIAGKDKSLGLAFAAGAAKTTAGRYTSTLILKGAQAIKDKTIKADEMKLTGWRAEIAKEIGDAYMNDELRQAAIDSAYYARAGLEAEGTGSNSQAVRLATGGITERNGRKVPLPYGMEESAFEDKLKKLSPANVLNGGQQVLVAGRPMPMADFLRQVPDAQLVHAGNSRYAVMAGGGVATDDRGRPVVLEVK